MSAQRKGLTGYELPEGKVIEQIADHESGYSLWSVECAMCGHVRALSAGNIMRSTGKCGKCAQLKSRVSTSYRGKRRPEFVALMGAKERCGYIKGRNTYEDKGIKIWQGWLGPDGFSNFFEHIGPKLSDEHVLDRVDNQGDYTPGNVRWATRSQSNVNKSNSRIVTIGDETKCLTHWCQDFGIYLSMVESREKAGWSLIDAITKPYRTNRPDIDTYYLDIASKVAVRSTCIRREVGCVITDKSGYCVSTGYNSVPSSMTHCTTSPCPGAFFKSGENVEACCALHSEDVALMKCADVQAIHTVYVTTSPCIYCTRKLMNTSAKRIVFLEQYPNSEECKKLWESVGRQWIKLGDDK